MMLEIYLENEAATQIFAQDLGLALKPQDFVALRGDLGAGKSTLARALIRTLMCEADLEVPSPTFSLVQHYENDRFMLAHADLYRLSEPQEIEELGLLETLRTGILLIEWPEQAGGLLPKPNFALELDYAGNGRQLRLRMSDEAATRFARSQQIRAFLAQADMRQAQRYYLAGDASSRRYETILTQTDNGREHKYVLMDGAQMHPTQPNNSVNYAQTVNLAQDVRQFVELARLIKDKGFGAPQIFAQNIEQGLVLLEHLGQETLINEQGLPLIERYQAAAELLAELHATDWADRDFTIPTYDRATLMREVALLLDWYVPYQLKVEVTDEMRALYASIWDEIIDQLQMSEQVLCLRDYHSPNLIWREDYEGRDRLGLIDFQDALILAQDARVDIVPEFEAFIINHYCAKRRQCDASFNEEDLRLSYSQAAAQRAAKILGLFVRLDRRDGKADYLQHLPRMINYLERATAHHKLEALRQFCYSYKILDPNRVNAK